MNEFVPPTARHFWTFTVLVVLGTSVVVYSELRYECTVSLERLLNNAVSVLILSTAWTIILVEGFNMFAEAWIERRRKRIQEEEREAGLKTSEENLAKLLETRPLTKDDLPRLRQILSTGSDS